MRGTGGAPKGTPPLKRDFATCSKGRRAIGVVRLTAPSPARIGRRVRYPGMLVRPGEGGAESERASAFAVTGLEAGRESRGRPSRRLTP